MMQTIRLEEDARGVAVLTLARSEKRNAMSREMIAELAEAAAIIGASDTIRVVVLAAEGPVFCAGGDLNWMREQMAADATTRRREATALANTLGALDRLAKPLIARVQGDAYGGGIGLMSICDVVVAAAGTRFGLTETRLGLIPATIGPYVVARTGAAKARRVFFSSRIFDAEEARELGLVAQIVPGSELDKAVEDEVAPFLECAPGAVAAAKSLVARLGKSIDDQVVSDTVQALVERWESDEAGEGTAAFFDKRPPSWQR
ncbi:MAG: crotonase/enoyl-CoA hydratase family protein [Boseongicola sp.]